MEELRQDDPTQMGSYRLLNRIGSGGMGVVFLGQSPGGRPVAIKVIRSELANDPGFRARFANEVAAARAVHGFFTALVVDADPDAVAPWLATAYVPGPSLAYAVEESGPLPIEAVRTLAAGLAEGLAAIHAAGLVHRDLKPSNVLLAQDGPRVIDFGISRAAEGASLTASGGLVGTPAFMSPEQVEGGLISPASDIFSLGAVLAYAATGEGPFGAGNTFALLYRVVNSTPDINNVPDEIRPLVDRCLSKSSSDRPDTRQLLSELGAVRPAIDWLPQPITRMLGRYDTLGQGNPGAFDKEAVKAVISGRTARRRARLVSEGPSQSAAARLRELEDANQRRREARELYQDLEQVDTASQLAKQLRDLSRRVGHPLMQSPTLPATAKPADIEAVAAGRLIPDQDLLDMFLKASGVHPEHLEPWHEALDRVTAATLIIEYRARAIELARGLEKQIKSPERRRRTWVRAVTGIDNQGHASREIDRAAEFGRLNGLARAIADGLDEVGQRMSALDEGIRLAEGIHVTGIYDLDEAREWAVALVQALAAIQVDASGIDLSRLDVTDLDAAIGVTWSSHTQWPTKVAAYIRQRSREIRPGVFQVT